MMGTPILGYWNCRGLAEYIRYLLKYAGVEFRDKRYEFGPLPNFKAPWFEGDKFKLGLDFPNLPYYIEGDFKVSTIIESTVNLV